MKGTSVIGTWAELTSFLAAAYEQYGDPSASVCLLLTRWSESTAADCDYFARWDADRQTVNLEMVTGAQRDAVAMAVAEEPLVGMEGVIEFGVQRVAPGVWALAPSLNIPGQLHAFVVLHGVPEPPPWESRIILVPA